MNTRAWLRSVCTQDGTGALGTLLCALQFHGVVEGELMVCCALCPGLSVQSLPPACSVPVFLALHKVDVYHTPQEPGGDLIPAFQTSMSAEPGSSQMFKKGEETEDREARGR